MASKNLVCQVCLHTFKKIGEFKTHVYRNEHRQKMKEIFQKDLFKDPVFSTGHFPHIVVMTQLAKYDDSKPIIGLSLLTVIFSLKSATVFYLCHVCEEKCSQGQILSHLFSPQHYSSYYTYTNPNMLSFAWIPSMDMRYTLKAEAKKEVSERGSGPLQMLDLPENLLSVLEQKTYSEVMCALSENDKLFKLLQAVKPTRVMIQTYHKDCNRKHPLLGMQHLVECICAEQTEKRHYFCTLCNLTVATHRIINHVLSFDHIFCYFKAWHPSTLLSKQCYNTYNSTFSNMILDFAKQTEEIHKTANTDMKQVSLETAVFTSVSLSCFAEGLNKLEAIRKENKESSLTTSITPGVKLVQHAVKKSSFRLRCQDCSLILETVPQYVKHVKKWEHKHRVKKIFGPGAVGDDYDQTGIIPNLGLCRYIASNMESSEPIIGVRQIVMCLSSQADVTPIYVCFACEDSFPDDCVRRHLNSKKHLIHTLLYQNPWRLPFAWENQLDMQVLRSLALEEQRQRDNGQNHMIVKVFDVPYWIFDRLGPYYQNVLERLQQYQRHLRREVPDRDAFGKHNQNPKFPLLGQDFLVKHGSSTVWGFLCLLCQRRLSEDEFYAHVFSREHVAEFLENVHPGSLDSRTNNTETLLDLAKQAALIHPVSPIQEMQLSRPIREPCSYETAKYILSAAKKRSGGGALVPEIIPQMKLVPTETVKEVNSDHDNGQEKTMSIEGSETERNQQSADKSETSPQIISSEAETDSNKCCLNEMTDGISDSSVCKTVSETETEERNDCAEITSEHCVESKEMENGENAETGADKQTLTQNENESGRRRELSSETASEQVKISGDDKLQVIEDKKTEVPEELPMTNSSCEASERCQHTGTDDGAEHGKESNKRSNNPLTEFDNYLCQENEIKQSSSMSEKSHDSYPREDLSREMDNKRQRIVLEENTSWIESHEMLINGQIEMEVTEETTADTGESTKSSDTTAKTEASSEKAVLWHYLKKKNRKPVVGLCTVFECLCDQQEPIYLCECCSRKISEQKIISHVTGSPHQMKFLVDLQKLPFLNGPKWRKNIRCVAATYEQLKGYGNAQVVDLNEEMYKTISEENFQTAMKIVKELLAQQDSGHELPPSSVHHVQPDNTSAVSHAQHKLQFKTENFQVLDMELDDSEDYTTRASSDMDIDDSEDSDAGPSSAVILTSHNSICKFTAPTSNFSAATSCPTTLTTTSTAAMSKFTATASSCAAASSSVSAATSRLEACEKTEGSATTPQIKNSEKSNAGSSPHVHKTDSPTTSSLPTPMSIRSGYKTSPKETSGSKMRPRQNHLRVGINQLIVVMWEGKQQVYCMLCSVRLKDSNHVTSLEHRRNYVSDKFPKLSVPLLEKEGKLLKIIACCAQKEKNEGLTCQRKEVSEAEYKLLASLPVKEALDRLKSVILRQTGDLSWVKPCLTPIRRWDRLQPTATRKEKAVKKTHGWMKSMTKQQGKLQDSSSSTTSAEPKSLRQGAPSASPSDDSHPNNEKKPPECPDSLATGSKIPDTLASTVKIKRETLENCQKLEKSDPELRDTQKLLEGTQQASPLLSLDPQSLAPPASVNTEQQNPRKLEQKEHVSKLSGHNQGQRQPKVSQVFPSISEGGRTGATAICPVDHSHLSIYLNVLGMDTKPIIGLSSVWECRGISVTPFFLCETCGKKLSKSEICHHLVSAEHQFNYMWTHYRDFLYFWSDQDLPEEMKLVLLREIAQMLSDRERFNGIHVQVVLLVQRLYEQVYTVPFNEALNILKNIKKEQKVSSFCQPIATMQQKSQQLKDQWSEEKSLPTEPQSAQTPETDQSRDKETGQEPKHRLEETVQFGDMEENKQGGVVDPNNGVSSNSYSIVSPCASTSTCQRPQETYTNHTAQPADTSLISPAQKSPSETQPNSPVKQPEDLKYPTSSSFCPQTTQITSVSSSNELHPTNAIPAVACVESLVGLCTHNPQPKDPLPAECTDYSLQPIRQGSPKSPFLLSESTAVNPVLTPVAPSLKDKDRILFENLHDLVREMKFWSKVSSFQSNLEKAENILNTASLTNSESFKTRWDSECKVVKPKIAKKTTSWDSKFQLVVSQTKTKAPSTNSLNKMISQIDPVDIDSYYENQQIIRNPSPRLSDNTSLEGYTTTGNILDSVIGDPAVSATLPNAYTVNTGEPQPQESGGGTIDNMSQSKQSPIPCAATNQSPSQTQQTQCDNATGFSYNTGAYQLPIHPIITARPDPTQQQLMGGYKELHHTAVNRDVQDICFDTVATQNHPDSLSVSTGNGQFNQMPYHINGHSNYHHCEAFAAYTANSPPACAGNLNQNEAYTRDLNRIPFYPQQQEPVQFNVLPFAGSSATQLPLQWVNLGMQQPSPWTSTAVAAGVGQGTTDISSFEPFTHQPVRTVNCNNNSLIPNSNNTIILTQNAAQGFVNPPVIQDPSANIKIIPYAGANFFLSSPNMVVTPAPSNIVYSTPDFFH